MICMCYVCMHIGIYKTRSRVGRTPTRGIGFKNKTSCTTLTAMPRQPDFHGLRKVNYGTFRWELAEVPWMCPKLELNPRP